MALIIVASLLNIAEYIVSPHQRLSEHLPENSSAFQPPVTNIGWRDGPAELKFRLNAQFSLEKRSFTGCWLTPGTAGRPRDW